MTSTPNAETHSWTKSIFLHLLPGILIGGFYYLVRGPLMSLGFPPVFALSLGAIFVLIPIELGYLLYQGKMRTGRFALKEVISYRQPIPVWEYFVWVIGTFIVSGLIFTLLSPVDKFLQDNFFFWVPAMESGLDGTYSQSALLVTYIAMLVLVVIVAPLVEELYFRGYLLPRTPGKLPALTHSFLFAAYHTFSPWMIVTRTIGLLPLIYAVRKKNIYVGIIVHILVNSIDVIMGFVFIVGME